MLTRLKISGFINLVDIDLSFSPFTCIAGSNGVGKSNLFDAIQFLSALSDRPLIDAALSIRDEGGRTTDIRSLFHRVGDRYVEQMSFEAEMLIPKSGVDDLGQEAQASSTFLRYTLILGYRPDQTYLRTIGSLEILKEELVHINKTDLSHHLLFPRSQDWIDSVFQVQGRSVAFISTEGSGSDRVIRLHQDSGTGGRKRGGMGGKPRRLLAINLPRTVLSDTNSAEGRTALLVRREMQSWRILQLEPSALRKPDQFVSSSKLGEDGSHLPATLYRLAHHAIDRDPTDPEASVAQVYSQVANSLSELIEDVRSISVDRDEKRELLTLQVTGRDGTVHPARALSDGTLRFLALAILQRDPETQGLLCLEEPENGIHPERIPAILQLLQNLATDINESISFSNPLRQVIINTHSPAVVQQVPEDSLIIAELKEMLNSEGIRFKAAHFSCLPNTWRSKSVKLGKSVSTVSKGKLLSYLNPVAISSEIIEKDDYQDNLLSEQLLKPIKSKRVIDRPDMQQLSLTFSHE
ncbi:MAG: AAA family ATPase [Pseudanabaena sp.]